MVVVVGGVGRGVRGGGDDEVCEVVVLLRTYLGIVKYMRTPRYCLSYLSIHVL